MEDENQTAKKDSSDMLNPDAKDYLAMIIAMSETTILPFLLLIVAVLTVGIVMSTFFFR